MFIAQSMGEYAGSRIIDRAIEIVSSSWRWMEESLARDTPMWMAAGACLLIGMWLFRRR